MLIDRVIRKLSDKDSRYDWWVTMRELLAENNLPLAMVKLRNHNDDIDYREQIEVVADCVKRYMGKQAYEYFITEPDFKKIIGSNL